VPSSPSIYIDTDNSGTLSAGDAAYVPGGNDPTIGDDDFVNVLVLNDIPASAADNDGGLTRLSASARTGSGAQGTVYAGQGDGGVDAVVGTTGASAAADSEYEVSTLTMTVNKSQTVTGAFGAQPVPGAQINYSVVITVTGSDTATNAVFTDNIPANTTYVPGSLQLNASPLTDAADGDAGDYASAAPARVRVTLGNLTTASGPQTVSFAVTIN
jgi:uncharacterized repeat protein (TIGR01451 family)